MTDSIREVLRSKGIVTLSLCSLKRLISYTKSSSMRGALSALKVKDAPSIALQPELGGRLIESDQLITGDLLIISGPAPAPIVVSGPISYAVIYLGEDAVASAPAVDFDQATTVCVLRPSGTLNPQILREKVKEGEKTQWGRALQAVFRLDEGWDADFTDKGKAIRRNWIGHINLGTARAANGFFSFYLPRFIPEAYQAAGVPVTLPIQWTRSEQTSGIIPFPMVETPLSPDEVDIQLTGRLGYVGHLQGPL